MHPSAFLNAKKFFQTYMPEQSSAVVVEIGAQNINGSIREIAPPTLKYIGVDFAAGNGVDVVLDDPYKLPFENDSVDVVVTSSCLEHSEMFWVLFLEIMRILRSSGLLYINVPTNGDFHRYPVDCWRFYPDSGDALILWAKRNAFHPLLLESFVDKKYMGIWNDYVAVFLKEESQRSLHPNRMIETKDGYFNGKVAENDYIRSHRGKSPDQSNAINSLKRWYWDRMYQKVMSKIKSM